MLLILSVLGLGLSSCGPLSRTQLKTVHEYYEATVNVTDFPKELVRQSASSKFGTVKLYPLTYDDDSLMVDHLIEEFSVYKSRLDPSSSMARTIDQLEEQSEVYFRLTPNGFKHFRVLKSGSMALTRYLGFGFIPESVFNIERKNPRPRGRKKIYNQFKKSLELVPQSLDELKSEVDSILVTLESDEANLRGAYMKFLKDIKGRKDSYAIYSMYNPIFLDQFTRLHEVRLLGLKTIELIESWKLAHAELAENIDERKRLKEGMKYTQEVISKQTEVRRILIRLRSMPECSPSISK